MSNHTIRVCDLCGRQIQRETGVEGLFGYEEWPLVQNKGMADVCPMCCGVLYAAEDVGLVSVTQMRDRARIRQISP